MSAKCKRPFLSCSAGHVPQRPLSKRFFDIKTGRTPKLTGMSVTSGTLN